MARRDLPLRRDTNDQKVAGVCSGIAQYFDVDTTLVRVLFVVFALIGGGAIIAYGLLWWLLDPMDQPAAATGQWPAPVDDTGTTNDTAAGDAERGAA